MKMTKAAINAERKEIERKLNAVNWMLEDRLDEMMELHNRLNELDVIESGARGFVE